jgi:teichuronic acid biosynthesis glycosyltransferase TuaH
MNLPFFRSAGPIKLVWFSEIQWDFLSTRKQRILARFGEEWSILFIEPFALGRRHHWLPVKRGRVWVVTIPFLKSVPFQIGRILDNSLLRMVVSLPGIFLMFWWIAVLGFASRERIIGLSNIYWGRAALLPGCRFRFYDANDDHLAFSNPPLWLKGYLTAWLSKIDLLFSVSPELTARLKVPRGVRTIELGNGVEFTHFAHPRNAVPKQLVAFKGTILGYAGAMDWLDTTLVAATARAWPEYSIVLIGPAYEQNWWKKQEELSALPNVHYFGKVDYEELPAWVQRFDLALMPLLRNRLKGVSHPNKLYEYCAAGVPVLSMNYCSAVDRAREVVHVADSHEAFVGMVALALKDRRMEARQEFARRHSWDSIASVMEQELLNRYQERIL